MRPFRSVTTARLRRSFVLAGAALLVVACGGPDDGVDDDGLAGSSDTTDGSDALDVAEDTDEPADDVPADTAEQTDEADEADDEATDDGGLRAHRPPAEAEGLADCSAVTEDPPGAVIVFPSDHDPAWLEAGPGPVTVEVIGCSDTFEANLQYEAYHGQNSSPTLDGFTQGGTLGEWGAFSFEETYWTPGDWTVVVFDDDAESGQRVEFDEVTFTVD